MADDNQTPAANFRKVHHIKVPDNQVTKQDPCLSRSLLAVPVTEEINVSKEEEILPAQNGKELTRTANANLEFDKRGKSESFDIKDKVPGAFFYERRERLQENNMPRGSRFRDAPKFNFDEMFQDLDKCLADQGFDQTVNTVRHEWSNPEEYERISNLKRETEAKQYRSTGTAIMDDAIRVNTTHAEIERYHKKKVEISAIDELFWSRLLNVSELAFDIANIIKNLAEDQPNCQLIWTSDCGTFTRHIALPEQNLSDGEENVDDLLLPIEEPCESQVWRAPDQYLNEDPGNEKVIDEIIIYQPEDSSVNDVRSNLLLKQPSDDEIITVESLEYSASWNPNTETTPDTTSLESNTPRGSIASTKNAADRPAWNSSPKVKFNPDSKAALAPPSVSTKKVTTESPQRFKLPFWNSSTKTNSKRLAANEVTENRIHFAPPSFERTPPRVVRKQSRRSKVAWRL